LIFRNKAKNTKTIFFEDGFFGIILSRREMSL